MSILSVRRKRAKQPLQPVTVNRHNRFGKRLIKFYAPQISAFNPAAGIAIKNGFAWNFTGSEGKSTGDYVPTGRQTIVSRLVVSNGSADGDYIYASNYDGSTEPLTLRIKPGVVEVSTYPGSSVTLGGLASGDILTVFATIGAQSVSETWSVGIVTDNGGLHIYSNPVTGQARDGRLAYLGAGANNSTPWRLYTKPIQYVAVFDGILTNEELVAFARNPWQAFKSNEVSLFFDIAAASDLSAAAQATATATGAINQAVAMSGASVVIASATGAVNQSVGLSGAAASVSVANGVVGITASLAGDGFVESFASGALASALALEASAQSAATAAADLSTGADLAGTAAAQAASTGSIGLSVSLSADSLIQALAAANLDGGAANDLSGNAAAIASASGGIMQDVPVLGSATVTVTGSGGVSSVMQLEGAAMVSALAGGDLQVSALGLSANAIIQALAGGSIEMTLSLSADALAQALSVGTLTVGDLWSGAFIEKYTALAAERKYTTIAPERNYIYAS